MKLFKDVLTFFKCLVNRLDYNRGLWIHPLVKFLGTNNVHLNKGVQIHNGVLFDTDRNGKIFIHKGCNINSFTRIESMNEIILDENVLIGPHVYISDRNHEYKNINTPIMKQGYYTRSGVHIGEGSWLGIHSAVVGNVKIGMHCVIGANSVVTYDVPDFSIVVGNPGKVVKRYCKKTNKWEKVGDYL